MALQPMDAFTVLLRGILLLACFGAARFLYNGYAVRTRFAALKKQGAPMMPHSMIWGHLKILGEYTKSHPADISTNHLTIYFVEQWRTLFPDAETCPTVAYVDLWPVSGPILFSLHPKVSAQFTQTKNLPKHAMERDFLKPLTGNKDMVSSDGEQWRRWRTIFNPGFSSRNIMALVPVIMDDMVTFINILDEAAGKVSGQAGDIIQLEKLTTNLTFDIIAKATLGLQLNEQSGQSSPLKEAMLNMTKQIGTRPNLKRTIAQLNPWSRIEQNNRVMKQVIMPHIHRHLEEAACSTGKPAKETKSIMDLAAQAIHKEAEESGNSDVQAGRDPAQMESILQNMKAFLFAGHDTTATTICWCFKMLEEHPAVLARLRREHDEQLGPDPDAAADLVRRSPHLLLGALPYTLAVIKETLRLYTPAATARSGEAGFFLVDPFNGARYPTEGFGIGDGTQACHYREDVWPRAREFLPERWLIRDDDTAAAADNPLAPMKDAWRPFEQGPRNCIGQELAVMEMRLVLVLAARKFDVNQAWADWDKLRGYDGPKDVVDGERLYMVGDGTGHTKDETPVRVTRRPIVT